MNAVIIKISSFGILLSSLLLTGCGGDIGTDTNQNQSAAVNDIPFAYVVKPLNTQPAIASNQFQSGTRLMVRERISSDAADREILASAIGSNDYDVKHLNVSPDGHFLLFSARRADSSWNLFEYDFRTGVVRRIIRDDAVAEAGQDTHPTYTADGRIVFSSDRGQSADGQPVSVLYRMRRDGSDAETITSGAVYDYQPVSLSEGGLVFMRRQATPACALANDCWRFSLMQLDNTGAMNELATAVYTGSNYPELVEMTQDGDGRLLTLLRDPAHPLGGGDIAALSATISSRSISSGSPSAILEPGSYTGGQVVTAPEQISRGGWYSTFWPYRDGSSRMLVSWTQCLAQQGSLTIPCSDTDSAGNVTSRYGVWTYDPSTRTRQPVVSYFVPWQGPGGNERLYQNTEERYDNSLEAIDRDVLLRSMRIYDEMNLENLPDHQ